MCKTQQKHLTKNTKKQQKKGHTHTHTQNQFLNKKTKNTIKIIQTQKKNTKNSKNNNKIVKRRFK